MFSRRQIAVFASFVLMATAAWAIDRQLAGGSDAAIIGDAFAKLKAVRHFTGSVSVVAAVPVKDGGREAVITTAKGHFGLPVGKTLTGAWTLTVAGANDETEANLAEVDMAFPGDGQMYLRPRKLSDSLGLTSVFGTKRNEWVRLPASALWATPATVAVDAASGWQALFDAFASGRDTYVEGRLMSELVAAEPCWRFQLGFAPTSAVTYAEEFERLRLGRDLSADEKATMEGDFEKNAPKMDLWIAKASRELRQVVLSYVSAVKGKSDQTVVVTVQLAEYPPLQPVPSPL